MAADPTHGADMDLTSALAAGGGVVLARDHPQLRRQLSRAAASRELVRVMRGVYVVPGAEDDPAFMVQVVQEVWPDAVFTGETAAWLNGMVDQPPDVVTAVRPGRPIRTGHFRVGRARLPDELWVERDSGLRVLTQVMTAVDVIPRLGARLVDLLMRKSRDVPALLRRFERAMALSGHRPGNQRRRAVLSRTTTNPWSELERILHDLLEAAGITGWLANHPVRAGETQVFLDVAFPDQLLCVEVDGFTHHSSREAFERDRSRGNLLVLEGWQVLRFTWRVLTEEPQRVIDQIRQALSGWAR